MAHVSNHIASGLQHLHDAQSHLLQGDRSAALAEILETGVETSLAAASLSSEFAVDPEQLASAVLFLKQSCSPTQLKILALTYLDFSSGHSHELGVQSWDIAQVVVGENGGSVGSFLGKMKNHGFVQMNNNPKTQRNHWRPTDLLLAVCLGGNVSEQSFLGVELPESRRTSIR